MVAYSVEQWTNLYNRSICNYILNPVRCLSSCCLSHLLRNTSTIQSEEDQSHFCYIYLLHQNRINKLSGVSRGVSERLWVEWRFVVHEFRLLLEDAVWDECVHKPSHSHTPGEWDRCCNSINEVNLVTDAFDTLYMCASNCNKSHKHLMSGP